MMKRPRSILLVCTIIASFLVMIGAPVVNTDDGTLQGDGTNSAYADLQRPTFLEPGKYLNYSFTFLPIEGGPIAIYNTTDVSGYLHYNAGSINNTNYVIGETISGLKVNYTHTNPVRFMGLYDTNTSRTLVESDLRAAYTNGTLLYETQNVTDFNPAYQYTNSIDVYAINKSVKTTSGDQVCAGIVSSNETSNFDRLYYYAHFRTLVSYYRSVKVLLLPPDNLYASNISGTGLPTFLKAGDAEITTYLGARATVKYTRSLGGNKYETLFFDKHTGILLKAIMRVDEFPTGDLKASHELVFSLVDANVDFSTSIPPVQNEFDAAIIQAKTYLTSSVLNDSNSTLFKGATSGDGSALLDENIYTEANFQALRGLVDATDDDMASFFTNIEASALHDVILGGMYSLLHPNGSASGIKTVTDAAWAIMGTIHLGQASAEFTTEMLDFMENLLVEGTYLSTIKFKAFARDNDTRTVFHAYDNAIALLALEMLAYEHTNAAVKTRALNYTNQIVRLFYSPGGAQTDRFWNTSLWVSAIDMNGSVIIDPSKGIKEAAIAIIGLCEFYLHTQNTTTKEYAARAKLAFNQLLNHAWNQTNKGFIHKLDFNLNIGDGNQHLDDNAWMMLASIALLEAVNFAAIDTKNLTYYNVAYDTWMAIQGVLHDVENETYLESSSNHVSTSGSLGLLLSSLGKMSQLSKDTILTTTMNQTQYVYEIQRLARGNLEWKFRLYRAIPGKTTVDIYFPLSYSDANFLIRYGNGTVYRQMFNVTNTDGKVQFSFGLPSPPDFKSDVDLAGTNHTVAVSLNKTGFQPVAGVAGFHVLSAVQLATYEQSYFDFSTEMLLFESEEETFNATLLHPGENFTITVDIKNTATTKQYVNISFGQGNNVITPFTTIQELNASNPDFVSYTYNVSVLQAPDVGFQALNFSILKNGSDIVWGSVPVYVRFPISIKNVHYPSHLVDGGWYNVTFKIKNENPSYETSAKIKFTSEYLEPSGPATIDVQDINPDGEVEAAMAFKLKAGADILPEYLFQLETIWNNQTLEAYTYVIFLKPAVEVISISGPTKPVQNQPLYFSISIQNNRDVPVVVRLDFLRILDNGQPTTVKIENCTLAPGTNSFIYQIDAGIVSPWDFGITEYKVTVTDGGRTVGIGTVFVDVQVSVESVITGYVLIFAVIGVLILVALYKRRQIASVRR